MLTVGKQISGKRTCLKILEVAVHLNILQLQINCILFILDYLPEVNKDDLGTLPVEVLIRIVEHPAAVMSHNNNVEKNEEELFHLIWDKIKFLSDDQKSKYAPKVLKAIHLPVAFEHFKFFLLREVGHIPEARNLIMKTGEEKDVSETQEWYLKRVKQRAWMKLRTRREPIKVNGITVHIYSECVLIVGFPLFIYEILSKQGKKLLYYVGSPWAIEHMTLPFKLKVELKLDSTFLLVNIYHSGVVDRMPVRRSARLVDRVQIKAYPCYCNDIVL